MKKNDREVSDLLKKLQESFFKDSTESDSKPSKKKKASDEDIDDRKFQEKLAAMLGKAAASGSTSPEKKKKSKKNVTTPPPIEPDEYEPTNESIALEESIAVTEKAEIVEVPLQEEVTDTAPEPIAEQVQSEKSKKKQKSTPKPRKKREKKQEATLVEAVEDIVPEEDVLPVEEPQETAEPSLPSDTTVFAVREDDPRSDKPLESDGPLEDTKIAPPVLEILEEIPREEPTAETKETDCEELVEAAQAFDTDISTVDGSDEYWKDASISDLAEEAVETSLADPQETPFADLREPPKKKKLVKQVIIPPTPVTTVLRSPVKGCNSTPSEGVATEKPDVIRISPVSEKATKRHEQNAARDPDTIVIRPPVREREAQEPIVIRPQRPTLSVYTPTLQKQEPLSNQPIKIGKEVKAEPVAQPYQRQTEIPKPIMKKEQNTTFIPPTPISSAPKAKEMDEHTEKANAPAVRKPLAQKEAVYTKAEPQKNVKKASKSNRAVSPTQKKATIARTPALRGEGGQETRPARRRTRTINNVPVTLLSDEHLEEVLDDALDMADEAIVEVPVDEPEEVVVQPKKLSPLQRRQQQKQKQVEQSMSATELITRKSGLTEDDIAMIFELGYENELGRLVGYDNLKHMKTEHVKRVSQDNHKQYRTAFGYRGEEYAGSGRALAVKAAYAHDCKRLALRLILTALLSFFLLLLDVPTLLGNSLSEMLAPSPFLLPLASLALYLLTAVLSMRQLLAGLRKLFHFSPTPYSVPAFLLPFTAVYGLFTVLYSTDMLRLNFLSSLSLLACVVCDVLRIVCEMRVLRLLEHQGEKQVLVPAVPRKKKLRRGDKIVKVINDDVGTPMYQVRRANDTMGFFRRFNDMSSAARPFTVLIGASVFIAVLLALADAVYTESFASACTAFMAVLLLCAPVSAMFGYFYPLTRANRLLCKRKCALLGEEAVAEYSGAKTVIFRDTDLYKAEKCTEISVREGDDFKNDMRLAGILFRKLGGTLRSIGESAPAPKSDPTVAIVRIQESGVEAVIDNRYHILAGDAEFLMRSGVRVPRESTDKTLRRTLNVSLMYVAIDGILKLSYEIEYNAIPTFEQVICDLAENRTESAVTSYDPNLDEIFVQKSRSDSSDYVRVIKPSRFEEERTMDTADTGAVSLGSPADVAYPLHAASAIGRVHRFVYRMQLIASILGAVAAVTLTLLGRGDLLGIFPIVGYQLFWLVVGFFATCSELNPEKLRFRKK